MGGRCKGDGEREGGYPEGGCSPSFAAKAPVDAPIAKADAGTDSDRTGLAFIWLHEAKQGDRTESNESVGGPAVVEGDVGVALGLRPSRRSAHCSDLARLLDHLLS